MNSGNELNSYTIVRNSSEYNGPLLLSHLSAAEESGLGGSVRGDDDDYDGRKSGF